MPTTPDPLSADGVVELRAVILLNDVPVAAPIFGVVIVGELANTNAPEPVSSEITPASCAEVVAANWASVPDVAALEVSVG